MGVIFFRVAVGGAAGLLVWLLLEPSAPKGTNLAAWPEWEARLMLALGAILGAAIGATNGHFTGGRVHTLRGLILGLLFGVAGATIGHRIGGVLYATVMGPLDPPLVIRIMARVLGIAPVGILLGAAIGASSLSTTRALQGAIGGGLGAILAGAMFDVVAEVSSGMILAIRGQSAGEVGAMPRALFVVLLGVGIALFIGLVERLSRSAWLRQALGRNEGREWPVDRPRTLIGRSETADVPIFGDPAVAPVHAVIHRTPDGYLLSDTGAPGGLLLNGHPVHQSPLYHGAEIRMGSTVLVFLMKSGQAPIRAGAEPLAAAYPAGAGPMGITAYNPAAAPAAPMSLYHGPSGAPSPGASVAPAPAPAYTPAPASQPTTVMLVALDGPLTGQRFPVLSPIELGRESASIPMSWDSAVSRRHATLLPAPGGVQVTDLQSTNGTFVDGQRVQSVLARVGSAIRIGATTFRVEPS